MHTTLLSHCNIFDFDTALLFWEKHALSKGQLSMDKSEKNTNNQKTNEKPGKGKKKGLTPHHLKKQIFLSNLYYTVHPEELEQILQDLNAELSKAGITLTADE